jgi:hypothetical protein
MTTQRLINQLGTGTIPHDEEQELIAAGTKFAGYFHPSCGEPILVTSAHEDIYTRWAEQITRQFDQQFGLPSQYRIPPQHISIVSTS